MREDSGGLPFPNRSPAIVFGHCTIPPQRREQAFRRRLVLVESRRNSLLQVGRGPENRSQAEQAGEGASHSAALTEEHDALPDSQPGQGRGLIHLEIDGHLSPVAVRRSAQRDFRVSVGSPSQGKNFAADCKRPALAFFICGGLVCPVLRIRGGRGDPYRTGRTAY